MGLTYKNTVFPAIAGALLVTVAAIGGFTLSSQNSVLEKQRAEISTLMDRLNKGLGTQAEIEDSAAAKNLGADPKRVATDTEGLRELANDVFTWDSDQSYSDARASVARVYGIPEDSAFMTSFLPPAPETRDTEGTRYSYIDTAGLNSRVGDVHSRLMSVKGINYTYMVLVTVQASSSDGEETSSNVATMFVTVDGDGVLSDVSGYAATKLPRSSG